MPTMNWYCPDCKQLTPHVEDIVFDLESATVWHCMFCGRERRPPEPGSPNEPVEPVAPGPRDQAGSYF
jgi:hypothetical protein